MVNNVGLRLKAMVTVNVFGLLVRVYGKRFIVRLLITYLYIVRIILSVGFSDKFRERKSGLVFNIMLKFIKS